jgi:hypothetical protein
MKDGWYNDDYYVLYEDQEEARLATARYRLQDYLPAYSIVGLKGWDDFILCDLQSIYYTVPTVPLIREDLKPFSFPAEPLKLVGDQRFAGRIKWYIKPIVFGGSPTQEENLAWLSHDQHAEVVIFWNKTYFAVKNEPT